MVDEIRNSSTKAHDRGRKHTSRLISNLTLDMHFLSLSPVALAAVVVVSLQSNLLRLLPFTLVPTDLLPRRFEVRLTLSSPHIAHSE